MTFKTSPEACETSATGCGLPGMDEAAELLWWLKCPSAHHRQAPEGA